MRSLLQRYLVVPIKEILLQGVTPEKIALSLAVGIVLGVFPVLGSTTILCAVAAILLKLNLPSIQLVNYVMYPFQLALIVPFMRAGEYILRARPVSLSLAQMLALAKANMLDAVKHLWIFAVHAVIAWLLLAPLAILLLYRLLTPALVRMAALLPRKPVAAE